MTTLLTDNLPLLAVAPNGIEKLRELILELAVRGKLVQQDSSDEPASKLLKLITEEKSWLIAEGMIKKQKPMPEISNQEILFPLPKGWVWLRVGDLALSILSGGTPSKNIPEYWGGAIPWASVKDLNVYRDLVSTQDYITKEGLDAGSKLASKGDVLICTRMGLGKIAIAAMDVAPEYADIRQVESSTAVLYLFSERFMTYGKAYGLCEWFEVEQFQNP